MPGTVSPQHMQRIVLFVSGFLLLNQLSAQDGCSSALPITSGTYLVSAVNGPEAPPFNCTTGEPATAAEWYSFTPTSDHGLKVSSELLVNTGGDTRFHIYRGSCGSLTCVGGDDDAGSIGNGYLSIDSLNVMAGNTYYIVWDNRWSSAGFTFEVTVIPSFTEPLGFTTVSNPTEGYVLAVVDMNDDQLDDIVTVDSTRILVHYQQADGSLEVTTFPTTEADNEPSWSLCAGDLNGDGHNDLVYGGGQGVTLMLTNSEGTAFTEVSYPQYVFSQRSNMVDINNDGDLDAFVCHDVDPNVFFMNNGSGGFTFNQGGLGDDVNGGNYGSIWIDYDNDRDLDLFIAKCRGGQSLSAIDEMHRNNGDGTFTNVADAIGLAHGFHQSWSSAWGDYDLDGDLDVVVGASSDAFGSHIVMRNDNGTFTDVTVGSGLDTHTGLSTEWTTHDFNNDGRLDILGGGALYIGTGDLTFELAVNVGNHAIGDLNDDGYLDILGGTSIRYNNGGAMNWLKVHTVGTVSNGNGIGARILVTTPLGTQIREVRSGDGFRYMSSLMAHFGLGNDEVIEEVRVLWPSGLTNVYTDVDINSTFTAVESPSTAVETDAEEALFAVYPNPAQDHLLLGLNAGVAVDLTLIDARGSVVYQGRPVDMTVDVSGLPAGLYTVRAQFEGTTRTARFTKL